MVKELILGQVEIDMLGSGKMIKDMVRGHISMQMEEPKHNITDLRTIKLEFFIPI